MTLWVTITADRVLHVSRGRDVMVCDRDAPTEMLVRLSPEAVRTLRLQINRGVFRMKFFERVWNDIINKDNDFPGGTPEKRKFWLSEIALCVVGAGAALAFLGQFFGGIVAVVLAVVVLAKIRLLATKK